ncbi:hypothetical protein [uncultured Lactobacillus sp.]|uniref:hypothetical protein n=1 Tax=uncultured Lactobacillus sp. TaxID=153152 RepID=UPI002805C9D9|nr:hypothetical protein [uncultured Lactobacillus sp.]
MKKIVLSNKDLIDVIGGSTENYVRLLGPDGGYGGSEGRLIAFADMSRRRI